jgi:hypothetical protein
MFHQTEQLDTCLQMATAEYWIRYVKRKIQQSMTVAIVIVRVKRYVHIMGSPYSFNAGRRWILKIDMQILPRLMGYQEYKNRRRGPSRAKPRMRCQRFRAVIEWYNKDTEKGKVLKATTRQWRLLRKAKPLSIVQMRVR